MSIMSIMSIDSHGRLNLIPGTGRDIISS